MSNWWCCIAWWQDESRKTKNMCPSAGRPRPPYIDWGARVYKVSGPYLGQDNYLYGLQTTSHDPRSGGCRCFGPATY
jgi:hypothetical protein